MTEKKFEYWFKSTFKDLHKMVEGGDHIARNHKKALWLGYESRQAEVNALKQRITTLEIDVHIRDKIISDALKEIKSGITGKHHVYYIIKILKGESNE